MVPLEVEYAVRRLAEPARGSMSSGWAIMARTRLVMVLAVENQGIEEDAQHDMEVPSGSMGVCTSPEGFLLGAAGA